jgi:TP901 family phage tail tape measure protein
VRTVGVKLVADVSQYMTSLKRAGVATKDFAGGLDQAAKGGKLDKVSDQALRLGVVGVAAFGLVVKSAADFDKQMSSVAAATHASAAEMSQLRAAALQAGKDTQFSATQAAQGIEELSKAGVSTANILGGGLKGALDLAAAGQLDVGEAAETAATAMTQFGLSGGQVPHIADLLAAAAGKAQGSVHDMGFALKQSGLVASQFGLSVEDTTGTLAAFASAGLIGSDAGTSFKQMLLSLANPADKTKELMKQLGINAYDAQGGFVGITNLAGQLQTKLGGLTQAQRDAALAQIFGTDAIRAANVLYKQGTAGIQGWIDKTNDAGYAAETARIKTDNLAGDIERLKGSLETLAIESGSGANSGIRLLTKGLNSLVNQFISLPPAVGSSVTVLAGVGGASLLALAGFIKVRKGIAEAAAQLNAMGPAGEKAATGLGRVASAAGKAATAFIALQVAQAVVSSFQDDLNPQTDALALGLERWANGAQLSGEAARVLGSDMDSLKGKFKFLADDDNSRTMAVKHLETGLEALAPGLKGTNESLAKTQERITAVDQSLAQMVTSGNTAGAAATFARLSSVLAVNGVTVDEVRKKFPAYAAAVETAGTSTKKLSDSLNWVGPMSDKAKAALDGAKAGVKGVGGAAAQSAEDIKKMNDAVKELFGAQMSLDRAEIALRNGMVDLGKELKSGARSLSLNSAEGRKNRSAVLDQLAAIDDLREARLRHGWTLDQAQGKYTKDIAGLRKSMLQAGFSKKAVDQLLGSYKVIPPKVDTKINQPGMKDAKTNTQTLWDKLKGVDGNWTAHIHTTGYADTATKLRHLLAAQQAAKQGISVNEANRELGHFFAGGGWTGPGPKYKPAGVVHADEFVVRKESRQQIEAAKPGALDYMNRTGRWPGYAAGGVVMPFPYTTSKTKMPVPALPPGGQTLNFMVQVVRAAFPGLHLISGYRPGAHTLSGALSYHALKRATDWPPSRPLAEWINYMYKSRTKELITPWNELNIHNGARHSYSGAVFRQHNFAGGNAHDHWAMAGGGVLREPVFGVGASGDTYSFAERGPETVIPGTAAGDMGGGNTYQITINATPLSHPREIGREAVYLIQQYEAANGSGWRK